MPVGINQGAIMSETGVLSSVSPVYSIQIPDPEGSQHELWVDITINDVTTLELWPEVTLDGTNWYPIHGCDKTQILWSFTADFSGALLGGHASGNSMMTTLPLLGHAVRWAVKPTVTATTGADVDLSLQQFHTNKSAARSG